jgi:hypothetical protein
MKMYNSDILEHRGLSSITMNPAAPDGAPQRRIKYLNKNTEKLLAPPCLGEALRRGTLITE